MLNKIKKLMACSFLVLYSGISFGSGMVFVNDDTENKIKVWLSPSFGFVLEPGMIKVYLDNIADANISYRRSDKMGWEKYITSKRIDISYTLKDDKAESPTVVIRFNEKANYKISYKPNNNIFDVKNRRTNKMIVSEIYEFVKKSEARGFEGLPEIKKFNENETYLEFLGGPVKFTNLLKKRGK